MGLVTSCTCSQEDKYRFKHYVVSVYPRSREAREVNKDAVDKLQSYIASNPERIPRVCRKVNKLVRGQLQNKEVERVVLSVTLLRALIEHARLVDGFVPGVLTLCEQLVQPEERSRGEDTVRYSIAVASLVTALCLRLRPPKRSEDDEVQQPSVQYASARRLVADSKRRLLPTFVHMCTDPSSSGTTESEAERVVRDGAAAVRATRLRCRFVALVAIAHMLHCVPESLAGDAMELLPCLLHCLLFYTKALSRSPHADQLSNNNTMHGVSGRNGIGEEMTMVSVPASTRSAAQLWREVLASPPNGTEMESEAATPSTPTASTAARTQQAMQYGLHACLFAVYGAAQAVPGPEARAFVRRVLLCIDHRQMWQIRGPYALPVMLLATVTAGLEHRLQPLGWLVYEDVMDVALRHCLSPSSSLLSSSVPLTPVARTLAMKVHYLDRLTTGSERAALLGMLHSLGVILGLVPLSGSRSGRVVQRLLSLTVWRPASIRTAQGEASVEEGEADEPARIEHNDEASDAAGGQDEARTGRKDHAAAPAIDKHTMYEGIASVWQALLSYSPAPSPPLFALLCTLVQEVGQCQAQTTAMTPAVHDTNVTQLLYCLVRAAPYVRFWCEAEHSGGTSSSSSMTSQKNEGSLRVVPVLQPFLYSRDETAWRVLALRVLRGLLIGQPVLCTCHTTASSLSACNASSSSSATAAAAAVEVSATRRKDKSRTLIDASATLRGPRESRTMPSPADHVPPPVYTSEADIRAARRWLRWWCVQTCHSIKQGGSSGAHRSQESSLTSLAAPFCLTPACVLEVGELMAALLCAEAATRALPFVLQLLCVLQQRCVTVSAANAAHDAYTGRQAASPHDSREEDKSEDGSALYDESRETQVVQACTPLMQAVLHMSLAVLTSAGRQLQLHALTSYAEELLRRRRAGQLARCFLSSLITSPQGSPTTTVMQQQQSQPTAPQYAVTTGLTLALGSANTTAEHTHLREDAADTHNKEEADDMENTLAPASQLLSSATWLPNSRITHLPSFTKIAQLLSSPEGEGEGYKENNKNEGLATANELARLDWPAFFTHDALAAFLQQPGKRTRNGLVHNYSSSSSSTTGKLLRHSSGALRATAEHAAEEDEEYDGEGAVHRDQDYEDGQGGGDAEEEAAEVIALPESAAPLAARLGLQRSPDWPAIANVRLQLVYNTGTASNSSLLPPPPQQHNKSTTHPNSSLTRNDASTSKDTIQKAAGYVDPMQGVAAGRIAELLSRHRVSATTSLAASYAQNNNATTTTTAAATTTTTTATTSNSRQGSVTNSTTQTDLPPAPPKQEAQEVQVQVPATDTSLPTMRSPHSHDIQDNPTAAPPLAAITRDDSVVTQTTARDVPPLRKLPLAATPDRGAGAGPEMHRMGGEEMTTSPLQPRGTPYTA